MITVEQLTRDFGHCRAVHGLSFYIPPAEIVGFLGANGAGKTTTLRMLATLLPPTAGRAQVAGYDVSSQSAQVRQHVGYLPERLAFYDEMTVNGYLHFWARLKNRGTRTSRRQKVAQLVQTCGLQEVQRKRIGVLTKGYRQRLGVAQALLGNPEVLLLDEPTAGLDPEQAQQMRSLIRTLGKTVLFSTHLLAEAQQLCDRLIIIQQGRLLAMDTPAKLCLGHDSAPQLILVAQGPGPQIRQCLQSVPGILQIQQEAGPEAIRFTITTEKTVDLRPVLARTIVNQGWNLLELRSAGVTLEQAFLNLTQAPLMPASGEQPASN